MHSGVLTNVRREFRYEDVWALTRPGILWHRGVILYTPAPFLGGDGLQHLREPFPEKVCLDHALSVMGTGHPLNRSRRGGVGRENQNQT